MIRKSVIFSLLLLLTNALTFADSFTDAIQDLAMRTACVGQYSASEAGGGWYEDPHDYYTPNMIASRLAQESGDMTRTMTFYGVCFDYAQFAFSYIQNYKKWYNQQGMYESQFWLAGVHNNSNQIELMSIGSKNDYSRRQNGVFIKTYSNSLRYVETHNAATNHAWIWIERADGVWFWIDPTWTDNTGYVWYGYVSKSGKEIQCRPDKRYCKNYPSYLDNLSLPPAMGQQEAPSQTSNSTNREKTIDDAGKEFKIYRDIITNKITYAYFDAPDVIFSFGFHTPKDSPFSSSNFQFADSNVNMGLSFTCESVPVTEDTWHSMIFMWQIDYFAFEKNSAMLLGINLGYQLGAYYGLGVYGGGGIGLGFVDLAEEDNFAWKWTVGSRLMLYKVSLRGELSYININKFDDYMIGMYIGIPYDMD